MDMEAQSEKQTRRTTNVQTQTETVSINGSLTKASLSLLTDSGGRGGELRWHVSNDGKSKGERILDFDRDVLWVEVKDKRIVLKAYEVAQKEFWFSGKGEKKRVRKDYVFEMETEEIATLWGRMISDCVESLGRPKDIFVIVNPFGGKKCGPKIFEKEVKPLLEAAGCQWIVEKRRLEESYYNATWNYSRRDIIYRYRKWYVAKSLLHSVGDEYSASNAAFAIIRGCKCPLDVASIVQGDKILFSVLLLTWGLVTDIDIESEKYRWMGSARLEIYSLLRIIGLRRYNGKIQFVPAPGYEEFGDPIGELVRWKSETVILQDASGNGGGSEMHGYRGASTEFGATKWRFVNGPFVTFWIHNVP
ncbi:Sphingosine kinase 1 [Rhynchospora pubera]|uniref:Sphingosine kinase 1 n=1 Tax=Rhynchospora pubera TaxID=906938 RepID=A0AAV8ETD7_9POAL|nr:Sphingosine kinase 1 [Rhynchospora pubera]